MAKKPSNDFGNKNPGNNAGSNANRPEAGHNSPNSGVPQSGSIGSQNNDLNNMNDQFANGQSMKHKPNSNKQPSRNGGLDDNGSSVSKGLGNAANNGGQNPNQNDDGIKDENTQPKKSIMGNTSAGGKGDKNEPEDDKGLFDKMSDLGHNAPQNFKALGSKIKSGYANFSDKATDKTLMVGQKLHWSMRRKTAKILIHALMIGGAGGGIIGLLYAGENNPLYAGYVCSTQNDNGDQYSGDTGVQSSGDWTKSGTSAYKLALQVFSEAKRNGADPIHAAAITGNAAVESMHFSLGSMVHQQGGGKGVGIFQFDSHSPQYGWSVPGQVKSIMNESGKAGGTDSSTYIGTTGWSTDDFLKSDKDIGYLTASFCRSFEAAGTPYMDQRVEDAKTALKLFADETKNIGSSDSVADSNSVTAEQANNAACNNQDEPQSSSDLVGLAKQFLHKLRYETPNQGPNDSNRLDWGVPYQDLKSVSQVNKDGGADCSSFVWMIMKIAGYKVPTDVWATGAMEDDAIGPQKYLKVIKNPGPNNTQAGDIFIINLGSGDGSKGHTGILEEPFHGSYDASNKTKIINEGGTIDSVTNRHDVNESTFGDACYPTLNGARVIIARPVGKG